MSMFDSLKSKLGIDSEAESYVDDTEDEIFPGGQGGAAAQGYTQQEVKQHSNKVVNINATTQLQVVLVKPERFEDASAIADQVTHNIDIVRRNDEGAGRHTLDLAVVGVGHAGQKVDQAAGDFLAGGLEIQHHRMLGVELICNGGGILKAFRLCLLYTSKREFV